MTWIDWATVACAAYAALLSTLVAIRQQLRVRGERELCGCQQHLDPAAPISPIFGVALPVPAADVTASTQVTLDRIRELRNVMFLLKVHLQQESIDRIEQLEKQACEFLAVKDADAVPAPAADPGIQAGDPGVFGIAIEDSVPIPGDPDGHHTVTARLPTCACPGVVK